MKKDSNRYWRLIAKSALAGIVGLFISFLLLQGCETMQVATQVGTSIASATGVISQTQAASIVKSTQAVAKAAEDFTPEQEYYIGRTIGAMILTRYKAHDDPRANQYINLLGRTLAQASDMPETFGGYHFLIQDSDEVNAFAAPGGLIFVTRGMLRCCAHEDALAAVLAHEIGHVQHKHGLRAIQKSRFTTVFTTLLSESARNLGAKELAELTDTFEGSISDITQTLVNTGYSRQAERDADQAAITILQRVGYDPNGLVDMLRHMAERIQPGGADFAKTHPAPQNRIAEISALIGPHAPVHAPAVRQARFQAALGNI